MAKKAKRSRDTTYIGGSPEVEASYLDFANEFWGFYALYSYYDEAIIPEHLVYDIPQVKIEFGAPNVFVRGKGFQFNEPKFIPIPVEQAKPRRGVIIPTKDGSLSKAIKQSELEKTIHISGITSEQETLRVIAAGRKKGIITPYGDLPNKKRFRANRTTYQPHEKGDVILTPYNVYAEFANPRKINYTFLASPATLMISLRACTRFPEVAQNVPEVLRNLGYKVPDLTPDLYEKFFRRAFHISDDAQLYADRQLKLFDKYKDPEPHQKPE